jgi:hypothetical protein
MMLKRALVQRKLVAGVTQDGQDHLNRLGQSQWQKSWYRENPKRLLWPKTAAVGKNHISGVA